MSRLPGVFEPRSGPAHGRDGDTVRTLHWVAQQGPVTADRMAPSSLPGGGREEPGAPVDRPAPEGPGCDPDASFFPGGGLSGFRDTGDAGRQTVALVGIDPEAIG